MFNYLKYFFIFFLIGIVTFLTSNYFFGGFQFKNVKVFWVDLGVNQLYSQFIGFSNVYFFYYLNSKEWSKKELFKRVAIGVLGSTILTVFCLFVIRFFYYTVLYNIPIGSFIQRERLSFYTFGLVISFLVVVAFHFFYIYKKVQDNKVKESRIVASTETAKFESLKNQLDPHFLFNSLNVLTSLIHENPDQAERFTTKLSKVYRYVLEQKDKDLTTLEEEINFAKSYTELLRMRFEDGLMIDIQEEINENNLKIVPLSLQLLLENAVKHNVINAKTPLQIKIYVDHYFLVIENNINPKTAIGKSTKIGLENIKNRYQLISNHQVEITNNNQIFKVKLPLLTQNIQQMETNTYNNESEKYLRAKNRVNELKGFYGGLITYCIVIPFLAFINYSTTGWKHLWFIYPMFGWGIGIVIHAFKVFSHNTQWEQNKIKKLMEKDNY